MGEERLTGGGAGPSKRDLAYACFLPPGLLYLISGVLSHVPMDTGTAGGVGFLVLVPLGLASLFAVPMGIGLSLVGRRDPALIILSAATLLMLVQLFAEIGPARLSNLASLGYGVLVMVLEARWFLFRRWRQ